jgi:putative membrane protein
LEIGAGGSGGRRRIGLSLLLLGFGLAACAILVWSIGIDDLQRALAPVRLGFVPIVLAHFLPVLCDVLGWRLLFREGAPAVSTLAAIRLIGEACNNLLPVAQIGGEFVRARVAVIAGAHALDATASVVADLTLGAATQMVFCAFALLLLVALYDASLAVPILIAIVVIAISVALFFQLQRRGSIAVAQRLVDRFGMPAWFSRLTRVSAIHERLEGVYGDRQRTSRAAAWRLAGWMAGAAEMYLTLLFLGQPIGWEEAVILEALPQALRSAAFAIPGGLGVQEAGFLAIGAILGLDPVTALAVGLIRRGRDVALGIPALAAYGIIEARRRSTVGRTT